MPVECKNPLSVSDADDHLARLSRLTRLSPAYRNHRVMGAVGAMVLPDDIARYAYRQGFFVLARSGDAVIIRNDDRFMPAIW